MRSRSCTATREDKERLNREVEIEREDEELSMKLMK